MESQPSFRRIGAGFCGTVWALMPSDTVLQGDAFKREDGGPGRSLKKEFKMHKIILNAMEQYQKTPPVSIPRCHQFIDPEDAWWTENLEKFPHGYSPCNTIRSDRIPPVGEPTRELLIEKFCPAPLISEIKASDVNRDCLIRLYLGRCRFSSRPKSPFMAFSLRNFPLHLDQMQELEIPPADLLTYSHLMAETLAILHWIGKTDANDVEFVLAPPRNNSKSTVISNCLGEHTLWILDFDCCNDISLDSQGVDQAVRAFVKNDPFYPRPTSSLDLWSAFRLRYIETSNNILEGAADKSLLELPVRFINAVEAAF
ncbi:hypothetical protein MGYG_04203 [Nannizzia gypsea CBS 118893]|uniref:DUF3669 domain-containing protein n=1 Tax=Arthroderma gypseum (strain ATCC MYA-4604 / CBS 118893) TaxID=535722 RepID=E4URS9_ARTGP|nr:hypothetical protein MGYG_04203 [Nannizzia gypsea CBS 118893]EFR01201.1 hypothetical protein MGYG_04203 [Nannizzia gypsea CBS 118893]